MALTAAQFKTKFGEPFSALSNERVDLFIAESERNIGAAQTGTRRDDMVGYMTAHLLTLAERGQSMPSGPVSAKTTSRASGSFSASPASRQSAYASTPFGLQYNNLIRATVVSRIL